MYIIHLPDAVMLGVLRFKVWDKVSEEATLLQEYLNSRTVKCSLCAKNQLELEYVV